MKLAHMDLKSSKILLQEKNSPVAKIGNLGLSVSIIEDDIRKKQQLYRQACATHFVALYPAVPAVPARALLHAALPPRTSLRI